MRPTLDREHRLGQAALDLRLVVADGLERRVEVNWWRAAGHALSTF
jgi:hypothetical protein